MKKPLAAALLTAAAVVTLTVPADAAVPKTKPTYIVPCGKTAGRHGSDKTAKIWAGGAQGADRLVGLAVENTCGKWLSYTSVGGGDSAGTYSYYVAPGAHFNWAPPPVTVPDGTPQLGLGAPPACIRQTAGDPSHIGAKIYSYKKVINIPSCT